MTGKFLNSAAWILGLKPTALDDIDDSHYVTTQILNGVEVALPVVAFMAAQGSYMRSLIMQQSYPLVLAEATFLVTNGWIGMVGLVQNFRRSQESEIVHDTNRARSLGLAISIPALLIASAIIGGSQQSAASASLSDVLSSGSYLARNVNKPSVGPVSHDTRFSISARNTTGKLRQLPRTQYLMPNRKLLTPNQPS